VIDPTTRSSRRGFSLIELLVVIGIIAILVALVLASLASARRQARAVKCQAAMREIANGFFLYANDHRGYYPVARWRVPSGNDGTGVSMLYWNDFIGRYVSSARFNQSLLDNPNQFGRARASVMWGCPNWDGISADLAPSFNLENISVYENGYTMNIYPTFEPDYPSNPAQNLPSSEWAVFSDDPPANGRWYRQTNWTRPANRALVVESILWLLGFHVSDGGKIAPQRADRGFGIDPRPGANHIDRYRHGRYPTPNTSTSPPIYPSGKGRVQYNVAFADGHVEVMHSIEDGYRAIRMRDP
jgi:prepilin-type N-terminal cleavage/methylation domain-containing protein/prepilin-type processing-associated H-X9-DG protein